MVLSYSAGFFALVMPYLNCTALHPPFVPYNIFQRAWQQMKNIFFNSLDPPPFLHLHILPHLTPALVSFAF